ncbi:hypothetical protein LOK49_LG12G02175 [Camellia lanceoleosa]|uniref:Uncharacterized protein n=1 Tax=Camellia lanceoleosa TaxID=1840588 RepID=A0ACC0FSC1_9ERIC|nr:hypothetical protein LOK49_LG12G02175 [Camellia lanceoleosa]
MSLSMGNLTGCSFRTVNLNLQWSLISSASRKRIELFERKSNFCFLCEEVSKRHRVLNRNFARSWCFGANNNGDNDGDSSKNASNDSNLATTTSRDEAEERAQSSDDFDSDESKASISSRINRPPPEVVKYFTDPNAIEPPDMQILFPFVESALPLAYGVLGVQLFHFKSILLDQKTKVDISMFLFAGATLSFSMFAVGLLLSSNPNAAGFAGS